MKKNIDATSKTASKKASKTASKVKTKKKSRKGVEVVTEKGIKKSIPKNKYKERFLGKELTLEDLKDVPQMTFTSFTDFKDVSFSRMDNLIFVSGGDESVIFKLDSSNIVTSIII